MKTGAVAEHRGGNPTADGDRRGGKRMGLDAQILAPVAQTFGLDRRGMTDEIDLHACSTPRNRGETSEQKSELGELLSRAETIARIAADSPPKIAGREQRRERRRGGSGAQGCGAQPGESRRVAAPAGPRRGEGREACDADQPAQDPRCAAEAAGEGLRFRVVVAANVGKPPDQADGSTSGSWRAPQPR